MHTNIKFLTAGIPECEVVELSLQEWERGQFQREMALGGSCSLIHPWNWFSISWSGTQLTYWWVMSNWMKHAFCYELIVVEEHLDVQHHLSEVEDTEKWQIGSPLLRNLRKEHQPMKKQAQEERMVKCWKFHGPESFLRTVPWASAERTSLRWAPGENGMNLWIHCMVRRVAGVDGSHCGGGSAELH